jgi:selenophosphate synthase
VDVDMTANKDIDMAIDMDVDMAADMDVDGPYIFGHISNVAQIF